MNDISTTQKARHPGLVLFALAVGAFAIGTTEFAAMSLVPFFADDLGISEVAAGHAISAYALGVVVGAPLIAMYGARLPRRTLLIGLMGCFAFANGLSAFSPDYNWLLAFRFLSGLPHGAYFGVAALVAASLVPANRRATSVALVMSGLTVATIIGVPAANFMGQLVGWRSGFGVVAALALLTMTLVAWLAPHGGADKTTSPMRELSALKRPQVILTLLSGVVGFGGMFAVYTYIASTLIDVTGSGEGSVPIVLGIFGIGMTIGTLGAARAADHARDKTAIVLWIWSAIALAIYPFTVGNVVWMALAVFVIGLGSGIGGVIQVRLMDVAGEAQTLAAAAHHSAFNMANALGPWLAGLAITAGYGLRSAGWIGSALALGGLAVFLIAVMLEKRQGTEPEMLPAE
ncbi:MFS transporter [Croceicoccus mobilis]|uniref:MFS transporter n=1 Tax=Croceicoccus mobilis TaxID=1703339 RepID=A0A916YWB8_9SPHN|nr:MFS transporter [Croceicoccus mobilis]GGD64168.1 MFS transporter [Croceicoccus mobilis]